MIHIILDRHWLLKDLWHLQISMDNCWWLSKWRHYYMRTASVESVPERCFQLLQQGKQASHIPNVHWYTRPMAASFARFEYTGCCRSTSCMTWKIKGMFNLRNKKKSYIKLWSGNKLPRSSDYQAILNHIKLRTQYGHVMMRYVYNTTMACFGKFHIPMR